MLFRFWKKRDRVYFLEAILETESKEMIFWSGTIAISASIELQSTGELIKQWVLERANEVDYSRKAVRYVRTTKLNYLHEVYQDENAKLEYIG